jgi:hypothetical protein
LFVRRSCCCCCDNFCTLRADRELGIEEIEEYEEERKVLLLILLLLVVSPKLRRRSCCCCEKLEEDEDEDEASFLPRIEEEGDGRNAADDVTGTATKRTTRRSRKETAEMCTDWRIRT